MATTQITIVLTAAQNSAIRKMSLTNKLSEQEFAENLVAQIIRGRFKALAESASVRAAEAFDKAVAGGFEPPMERADYIAKAKADYKDILAELS